MFQKDPQVLLAHPGQGIEKFEDLKNADAVRLVGRAADLFQMDAGRIRLRRDKIKPYTFNPQPFLVDKHSAMQGYVTSEPYRGREGGRSSRRSFCSPTRASTPTRR